MARLTIIECDRCGSRIKEADAGPGRPTQGNLDLRFGDEVMKRDVCFSCLEDLKTFLRNAPIVSKERLVLDETLNEELRRIREVANAGIERYGYGATADELAQVLRDVVSSARRGV